MPSAWVVALLAAAGPAADAAQAPAAHDADRRAAEEALRQLLAETDDPYFNIDYKGHRHTVLETRPRAAGWPGVCEMDELSIELGPAAPPPGPGSSGLVRKVEAKRLYHVLAGDDGQARRDLSGNGHEAACAQEKLTRPWTGADSAYAAAHAAYGLEAVERELARPESVLLEIRCDERQLECPDKREMIEIIEPLWSSRVWSRYWKGACSRRRYCLEVPVSQDWLCGSWEVRLEMDREDHDRLRRARLTRRLGSSHDCSSDEESSGI